MVAPCAPWMCEMERHRNLIGLANPPIDWVPLAGSLGVPAVRVETADALVVELERAIAEAGPHLIEMMI